MIKVAIVSLALFIGSVRAATINAASASYSDVLDAYNSASDGDTINIPAGAADWSSGLVVNKAVWIKGAGIDETIITNIQTPPNSNSGTGEAFSVTTKTTGLTRISHMTIDGNRTANGIGFSTTSPRWGLFRVHDIKFMEVRYRALQAVTLQAGLVDHCTFPDCFKTVDVYASSNGDENGSWELGLNLGSTNQVVIEDCAFLYQTWYPAASAAVSSSGQGARRTIRFCGFTNSFVGLDFFPMFDAHGNQQPVDTNSFTVSGITNSHRGTRQFEFYGNQCVSSVGGGSDLNPFDLRGGVCVVVSNTFVGNDIGTTIRAREEDAPYANNFRTEYPGHDQHWLWIHANTSRGSAISALSYNNSNATTGDPPFLVADQNVFWRLPTSGDPIIESWTPLEYPHPLIASLNSIGAGAIAKQAIAQGGALVR